MKKTKLFLLTLLSLFLGGVNAAWADTVSPYTVNFDAEISTSSHDFVVASNWGHIVDYLEYDYYGPEYSYVSYTYNSTERSLGAYNQHLTGNSSSASKDAYDLLVTPLVSGTITIDVKAMNYETASLQIYSVNDGVKGDLIKSVIKSELSTDGYTTISFNLDNEQKVGLRLNYVYIDNFKATSATILPEPKLTITEVKKATDESTVYYKQQSDGSLLVQMYVTLENKGEVDFVAGTTENYTLSVLQDYYGTKAGPFGSFAIPVDLAKGAKSDPILVEVSVPSESYSSLRSWGNWYVIENITSTQSSGYVYAGTIAYESKFVLREAGSTSTTSLSSLNWGIVSEAVTKNLEIANTGTAPLTINGSKMLGLVSTPPEGLTVSGINPLSLPEGVSMSGTTLTIAGGKALRFSVTNTTTAGIYSGTLPISYTLYGGEETNLDLTYAVSVIAAGTWMADFNNSTSTVAYPAGAIAEGGTDRDYEYISSGNYNNWIIGRNTSSYATENNKFITPKLHANAGDKLAFDVKAGYGSSYYVKVYVSTDRANWGEPVAYYTYSATDGAEAIGGSFVTKTVTFDAAGDYYVAFALYGSGSGIDNLVGLEKVDVAHDLYIKSVSWPDASIKSGTAQSKPSVDIIPLTNETADNYTVKYVCGESVLAEGTPVALTASANSSKPISFSWTPSVESTTVYEGTKVVFEFTDGTKFETETFDLTVTNEPIFHFLNSKQTSRWYEPTSDYTTPYNFGKTNVAGASKTFWILNWGSAPLTVKSIAVPEGFTASVSSMSLPAFDGTQDGLETCQQSFDITFSATEAGTYSGNLVVTYVNGAGKDVTFELAVSGTMLDRTLWYANFNDQAWPAGSVYQDNVSVSYINTGDYGLLSSSSTKNLFFTPKLTAAAGDVLQFDASTRNSYYDGTVKLYVATDRENLGDAVKEIELSKTDNVSKSTYEYTFDAAGDYYVAFALSEARVDDIYGLKLAEVKHDWALVSSSIPTEAMQNTPVNASVNIANFGVKAEDASSYTVTVYVDEEPVATLQPETALPTVNKLDDAGTKIDVPFKYGVVGTFPVYIEVEADGYNVKTEAVDVTFAKEEGKSDAEMATNGTTYEVPLYLNYKNSESVTLYNADALASAGLSAGAKIKAITYKGYKTTDEQTTSFQVYYKWTDDQTLAQPATTYPYAAADNGMTKLIDEDHTWTKVGSSSELGDMIVLDFSSDPLVYEEGKSLCIYMHSYVDGYKTAYFAKSTLSSDYCYTRKADAATLSSSWSKAVPAAIQFSLEASAATLTGSVTYDSSDLPAKGATVTLVCEDDNNVQYTGTTDEAGKFSIEVIQAKRTYTVTASKDGAWATAESVSDFTQPVDLKLKALPELTIGDETLTGEVPAVANVTIARSLRKGWNAIVFPFTLTADEVKTAIGEGSYELVTYDSDEGTDEVTINFKSATKIVAGTPYLLYLESMPASGDLRFLNKEITDETRTVTGQVFDFVGTFDGATTAEGDYFIQGGKLVKTSNGATVKPFRSYLKLKDTAAGARGIRFVINGVEEDNTTTAIEDAIVAPVQVEGVYNLQGQKVEQLKKGQLYIINGKKVLVK